MNCDIKGTATMVSRDWLDERLGAGWFHATIVAEHPDWPARLLPGDYYPLRPQMYGWHQALAHIDGHDGVETMIGQAAAATAERDLTTIYKAFLWATNPQLFMRALPRLWSSYAHFGQIVAVENVAGLYRARMTNVPEDLLVWATGALAGFLRPALLLAGGTAPISRVTDRRREPAGTWEFDYQLSYTP